MNIYFQATLEDGTTVCGPIQGCGGYIGSSALHAGADYGIKCATDSLRAAQKRFQKDRPFRHMYQPKPGHVAMYPDDCAQSGGEMIAVPLTAEFVCLGVAGG